jgi:hypothetical protein
MRRRTDREIAKWFARNPKVGIGLGTAWLVFAAGMSLRTLGWKETQGRVMSHETTKVRVRGRGLRTRTRTAHELAYQYDVGNERFTGSKIYPFWNVDYRVFDRESSYRPGQRVRVLYNPGRPSEAALTRSMSPDHLIAFFVVLGFLVRAAWLKSQRSDGEVVESGTGGEGDASGAIARAKARAEEARARKAALASRELSS